MLPEKSTWPEGRSKTRNGKRGLKRSIVIKAWASWPETVVEAVTKRSP